MSTSSAWRAPIPPPTLPSAPACPLPVLQSSGSSTKSSTSQPCPVAPSSSQRLPPRPTRVQTQTGNTPAPGGPNASGLYLPSPAARPSDYGSRQNLPSPCLTPPIPSIQRPSPNGIPNTKPLDMHSPLPGLPAAHPNSCGLYLPSPAPTSGPVSPTPGAHSPPPAVVVFSERASTGISAEKKRKRIASSMTGSLPKSGGQRAFVPLPAVSLGFSEASDVEKRRSTRIIACGRLPPHSSFEISSFSLTFTVNCHKNKKKCSTGNPCQYCKRTDRSCVYPNTQPGTYRTNGLAAKRQETMREKKRLQEDQKTYDRIQVLRQQLTPWRRSTQPAIVMQHQQELPPQLTFKQVQPPPAIRQQHRQSLSPARQQQLQLQPQQPKSLIPAPPPQLQQCVHPQGPGPQQLKPPIPTPPPRQQCVQSPEQLLLRSEGSPPVIVSVHEPVALDDTPPPSPQPPVIVSVHEPIVLDDTPPPSPQMVATINEEMNRKATPQSLPTPCSTAGDPLSLDFDFDLDLADFDLTIPPPLVEGSLQEGFFGPTTPPAEGPAMPQSPATTECLEFDCGVGLSLIDDELVGSGNHFGESAVGIIAGDTDDLMKWMDDTLSGAIDGGGEAGVILPLSGDKSVEEDEGNELWLKNTPRPHGDEDMFVRGDCGSIPSPSDEDGLAERLCFELESSME